MFKPWDFTKGLFYKLALFYKFYSTIILVFVRALFRISCVQAAFVWNSKQYAGWVFTHGFAPNEAVLNCSSYIIAQDAFELVLPGKLDSRKTNSYLIFLTF